MLTNDGIDLHPCLRRTNAKQRCVMGVGMCLYAQLVQTKNKQCKSAIISQCYHPHLSDFCSCADTSRTYYWQHGSNRIIAFSLFGTFAPGTFFPENFRSWDLSLQGTFVPGTKLNGNFCSIVFRSHQRSPPREVSLLCYSVGLTTAVKLYSSEVDTITSQCQNVGSCLKNGPAGAYKLCHTWLKRL